MGFADILGQLVDQRAGGNSQTRDRLSNSAHNLDRQGGGIGEIFGQLQAQLGSAMSGQTQAGGASARPGGLAEMAKEFLNKEQVGGMTTGQIGGIGAAAGALLGGGVGGAAKGGVMAVLGTMALSALRKSQAGAASAARAGQPQELTVQPDEARQLVGEKAQKLVLKAMISAAKADGSIDQSEMEKIIGKLDGGSVTAEEKQFVMDEMRAPVDVNALASEVELPSQAAEIYAASLLAIKIDTEQERRYLADLARALRLDQETVDRLHQLTQGHDS
jgi:uncharacterized membrane protein YebE (DUF533 family)